MYFRQFPFLYADFVGPDGVVVTRMVTDVTRNVRVRKAIQNAATVYEYYDIQDGETPEIISAKLYDYSGYHWVLMLFNDRYDYVRDWPMTTDSLNKYLTEKYGNTLYNVHHYVNDQGLVVDQDVVGSTPVTNYQYEVSLNDAKRQIKVVSPELIGLIMSQFTKIMEEQ